MFTIDAVPSTAAVQVICFRVGVQLRGGNIKLFELLLGGVARDGLMFRRGMKLFGGFGGVWVMAVGGVMEAIANSNVNVGPDAFLFGDEPSTAIFLKVLAHIKLYVFHPSNEAVRNIIINYYSSSY